MNEITFEISNFKKPVSIALKVANRINIWWHILCWPNWKLRHNNNFNGNKKKCEWNKLVQWVLPKRLPIGIPMLNQIGGALLLQYFCIIIFNLETECMVYKYHPICALDSSIYCCSFGWFFIFYECMFFFKRINANIKIVYRFSLIWMKEK